MSALYFLKSVYCSTKRVNLLMGVADKNLGAPLIKEDVCGSYKQEVRSTRLLLGLFLYYS